MKNSLKEELQLNYQKKFDDSISKEFLSLADVSPSRMFFEENSLESEIIIPKKAAHILHSCGRTIRNRND